MFKEKIAIIGAGQVGSTCAYTLMTGGLFSEIVLIDINREKAEGDALDMNHGVSFVKPVRVIAGDYSDCAGADIVMIAAGAAQRPGETRVDLLKRNAEIFRSIVGEIVRYCSSETLILVVTNPVDVLTYMTYKISGFEKGRVIGSGTVLDTSRFKYVLGEHTGIDTRNIHTYIIGEHGDSEVAAWSVTNIAGMSMDDYCKACGECDKGRRGELFEKVRNAAYEIIGKKGATYYAVALAVQRIVDALIHNENSILTVSSVFEGEYGISDVCLGVPTIVNAHGVVKILEIPFAEKEMEGLKTSAREMRALLSSVGF